MPSIEKHIELSLERTGKEYKEIHEWMDGRGVSYKEIAARHRITNVPKFLPIIEREFGKDAVGEYLRHIEDDYENNLVLRVWKILRKFLGRR